MAIIQYSGLVTSMKGKMGGAVLSGGKAGNIIRNNYWWKRPCSSRWGVSRSKQAYLSQQWRDLTSAERTQWNAAASSFPFVDKFGNPYTASGYQVFISLNRSVMQVGGLFMTTPPAPGIVFDIGTLTLANNAMGKLSAFWTNGLGASDAVQVFAAPPLSPGLSFRPGNLKLLKYTSAPGSAELDIETEYLAAYGHKPSAAQIWIQSQTVNTTTGQHGSQQTASYIVP
ncbi:MAG: hypothetical protein ACE5D0_09995 [Fidelibacterota bacterium]